MRSLLALSMALTTGCAGEIQHVQLEESTRSYYQRIPAAVATDPVPLVIVMHGGSNGNQIAGRGMDRSTGWGELALDHGFIAVYPNARDGNWNDGRVVEGRHDEDDSAFLSAMIAQVSGDYPVDPDRVFATGISNGGFMSNRVGCELSDEVAAIAPIIAGMSPELRDICAPTRPMPALFIPGTEDPLVPYDGGAVAFTRGETLSIAESTAFWAENAACSGAESVPWTDIADDGTTIIEQIHTGCADGAEVRELTVVGGGHTWPGGPQYLPAAVIGDTSEEFDTAAEVWAFFEAHPMP